MNAAEIAEDRIRRERRLAKFDAELALRGIVDNLPDFILRERERIADGRTHAASFRSDFNARTFNDDADARLDAFLAGGQLRKEADGCAMLDRTLGEFGHPELRHRVLTSWRDLIYNCRSRRQISLKGDKSTLEMRDMALRAIACLRADAFSNRVKDISIVSWDGSSVKSEVVERARKLLLDPQQLSARDWTGQLSEAVARAEHEIQQWKAEQARLETIHLERKAELERQLTSVGFIVQPHHVRVKCGRGFTTELELDVRHELAVEFSGIDPPLPVGVSVDGCLCVIDDNDVVKIADARSRPIPGPVDIELFRRCACRKPPLWRQSLASASWSSTVICLRWPPRLDYEGSRLLSNIVTDLESPVRVPVDLEMIAARRGTLLRALRAHGLAESRIPLGVGANGCAVAAVFLSKKSWPRSREMHSALVGDVASAQRGDIFASLPQLAIGVIYDCLVESWSSRSRTSLATVSDAFALGAAILEIERLPLKTAFKFPSPKLKPKVVPAFQATDRFDQFDDDPYHDNDYYDDDYYRSDYDYHYRY